MDRETLLQKAQNEKDERELAIQVKAYELAGRITLLVLAFTALFVVVDGAILGALRAFDYKAVAALLVSVGTLYCAVSEAYLFYGLRNRRKLVSAVFFAAFFIFAAGNAVLAFI